MNPLVVIAVRPPGEGKTRLASALDPLARAALIERMFRHVLLVALEAVSPARCHVVSRSARLLELAAAAGATPIRELEFGLNAALTQAGTLLAGNGPILALSADLPLLQCEDIRAMADALQKSDVIAATDCAGTGTNALLLREAGLIPYAFGKDSLGRHRTLSEQRSLRFAVIRRPGLSGDIDEPADLVLLPPAKSANVEER